MSNMLINLSSIKVPSFHSKLSLSALDRKAFESCSNYGKKQSIYHCSFFKIGSKQSWGRTYRSMFSCLVRQLLLKTPRLLVTKPSSNALFDSPPDSLSCRHFSELKLFQPFKNNFCPLLACFKIYARRISGHSTHTTLSKSQVNLSAANGWCTNW